MILLTAPRTGNSSTGVTVARHGSLLASSSARIARFKAGSPSCPRSDRRSREQAQPAVVSVADFTQAQLLRRSNAAGGGLAARKTERCGDAQRRYLFRVRIRYSVMRPERRRGRLAWRFGAVLADVKEERHSSLLTERHLELLDERARQVVAPGPGRSVRATNALHPSPSSTASHCSESRCKSSSTPCCAGPP